MLPFVFLTLIFTENIVSCLNCENCRPLVATLVVSGQQTGHWFVQKALKKKDIFVLQLLRHLQKSPLNSLHCFIHLKEDKVVRNSGVFCGGFWPDGKTYRVCHVCSCFVVRFRHRFLRNTLILRHHLNFHDYTSIWYVTTLGSAVTTTITIRRKRFFLAL